MPPPAARRDPRRDPVRYDVVGFPLRHYTDRDARRVVAVEDGRVFWQSWPRAVHDGSCSLKTWRAWAYPARVYLYGDGSAVLLLADLVRLDA